MQEYRYQFAAMTVPCELLLYSRSESQANSIAQRIHANTRHLEKHYNFYSEESWLSREVNRRKSNSVCLEPQILDVFQKVRSLSEATDGLFDITVGTLKHAAGLDPRSSRSELQDQFADAMGLDCWTLAHNRLELSDKRTRLDLGGVIKEYAVDQAAQIAQAADGASLINFGGDIRVSGRKPDGKHLLVGIKDPHAPEKIMLSLALENIALTTSGHYERKVQIGGVETSHIIGRHQAPAEVLSASVIAPTALEAGIYSTALMLRPTLITPSHVKQVVIDAKRTIFSDLQ